jgi:hypothetical protein
MKDLISRNDRKRTMYAMALLLVSALAMGCVAELDGAGEEDLAASLIDESLGYGEEPAAGETDVDVSAQAEPGFGTELEACCGTQRVCGPPPCSWQLICNGSPFPVCTWQWICGNPPCTDVPIPCPLCSHSTCSEGLPLSPTCDSTVAEICRVDPYCCTVAWDAVCVDEVETIAHSSCNSCS